MRSPVLAMVWENWRLTRVEAAHRLAIGIVAGSAVLVGVAAVAPSESVEGATDFAAAVALVIVFTLQAVFWLSIQKLNGGRFINGYEPGFPFYLLYARPVRTAALVGIPMAYLAASAAAFYVVSALVLRLIFGYPFPLLPAAAWIVALNLLQAAIYWSIRNKVVMVLVLSIATIAWTGVAIDYLTAEEIPGSYDWPPERWPTLFDFSLAHYALIGSIGLASFGLAVAAVSRQRHGDAWAGTPRTAGSGGFPERLVDLFQFPCPTSSATRAQAWFDLKSNGLPLLTIGLASAIAIPLLYAIGGPVAFLRPYATMFAGFCVLIVLLLGGNAFGIRRKQGRRYASPFEATQAYGTAQLAALKVLLRTACMLAALIALGVSVWASLSLVSGWADLPWDAAALLQYIEQNDRGVGLVGEVTRETAALLRLRHAIAVAVGALTGYQQAALAIVAFVGIAVVVALRAALDALWARYPRRVMIAGSLPLLYGLAFVLRALAGPGESGLESLMDGLLAAIRAVGAVMIVLAIVYLFRSVLAERLLTLRQAAGAVLVSAAFGAAWAMLLLAAGVPLGGMPRAEAVLMLSPTLLPLTAIALACWSLSRVRHA